MLTRRVVMRAALAAAVVPFGRVLAAEVPPQVALLDPIGPGSSVNTALRLVAPPYGEVLGAEVDVVTVPGYASATAMLLDGPADGSRVLCRGSLSTAIARLGNDGSPLRRLLPIGKLTAGMSASLVVAKDSPLTTWDDFAAVASSGPLTVARFGRTPEIPEIALAMLRRELGAEFDTMTVADWAAAVDALVSGRADVGIMMTNGLLRPAGQQLRGLCSFGGKRSPNLPDLPTFRELTQPKNSAFTAAFGLYGLDSMPGDVAADLSIGLLAVGEALGPDAGSDLGVRLDIGGPERLGETMKRDARIWTALQPWMTEG